MSQKPHHIVRLLRDYSTDYSGPLSDLLLTAAREMERLDAIVREAELHPARFTTMAERRTIALCSAMTRAIAAPTKRDADQILTEALATVQAHALQN